MEAEQYAPHLLSSGSSFLASPPRLQSISLLASPMELHAINSGPFVLIALRPLPPFSQTPFLPAPAITMASPGSPLAAPCPSAAKPPHLVSLSPDGLR